MLFPERMKDLTIVVHADYIDEVVDSLHERGIAEITSVDRDEEVFEALEEEKGSIPEVIGKCTDYDMKLASILDTFGRVEEEDESLGEMINPSEIEKVKREKKDLSSIFEEIDDLVENSGEKIKDIDEELSDIEEELEDLESLKEDLTKIEDLDVDLSMLQDSSFTDIRIGKISSPVKFKRAMSEIDESFYSINQIGEDEYVVITGVHIRKKEEFEAALREGNFKKLDIDRLKGHPKEALGNVYTKIKELKEKKVTLEEELNEMKEEWEKDYLVLREELNIYRNKKEVSKNFGMTDQTSVIKAWTPEDQVDKVEKTVLENSEGHAEVVEEEPEDPDEVPVSLDNPKPIKPFEILTNMFAPPNYDEVDPTLILAPAFVLFFGLMLGDAVYGILIMITSIVLIKGIGKVEQGTKEFGYLLLATGASTVIFGVLQGGYLGPSKGSHPNLMGRIGLGFINDSAILQTLEGQGPLTLLVISLLIGLAYLNLGMILQVVQHFKRGNYRQILIENISWWTLEPGGFILLSGKLFGWEQFTSVYNPTIYLGAGVLSAIGLALMVIRAKGLSFFELTGFIGDFLSFSRILALGLATSGIALTVNVLADLITAAKMPIYLTVILLIAGAAVILKGFMDKNKMYQGVGSLILLMGALGGLGYLGIISASAPFYILGLIIIIGGHLANAVLQALGAFVHSLRLQYVEFFGYFYEGGGSPFTPFRSEREHTKLEKDVME